MKSQAVNSKQKTYKRAKMAKVMGFGTPPDGLTEEERQIEKLIGTMAIENLYGMLPTSRMMAIVAMHFELGYPQDAIAAAFRCEQTAIAKEINTIKRVFLKNGKYQRARTPLKGEKGKIGFFDHIEVLL